MSQYEQLRNYHKKAFEHVSEALKIEESAKGTGGHSAATKRKAIDLYRKGISEFDKGCLMHMPRFSDDYERFTRLKEKMQENLEMTQGRLLELEEMDAVPSTGTTARSRIKPRPARPSTGGAMRHNGEPSSRSVSPAVRHRPSTSAGLEHPIGGTRPRAGTHQRAKAGGSKSTAGGSNTNQSSMAEKVKAVKGVDSKLANLILDQILETASTVTFDDIAGLDNAKQALQETVILPSLKPELFTGLRSPVQGILLFGPPGNGKSLLAKAVASEANCTFFNISASALTSKWVGEAEKLVKALFVLARELQPSIIFIDEVDSVLTSRKDSDNEVSRRLKTEFLLQFDGVGTSSDDRLLVMGATNRPGDLDEAVLRRFPKRIMIILPEFPTRVLLLQKLLGEHGNPLGLRDLQRIAQSTEGYSGWDLTQLAKDAAMGPIREVAPEQLKHLDVSEIRRIQLRDFDAALQRVRPSANKQHLTQLNEFNALYGDCSSQSKSSYCY